jgi:hypothetical protein
MEGKQEDLIPQPPDVQKIREYSSLEDFFASLKRGESQYQSLIAQLPTGIASEFDTRYSDGTIDWLLYRQFRGLEEEGAKDVEWIKNRISGQMLIDLGGGRELPMFQVAKKFDALGYINVDKYIGKSLPYDPLRNQLEQYQDGRFLSLRGDTDIAVVKADMLDFVARISDNSSVVYTLNGIDYSIIGDNSQYHEALATEIARTLKPGGIVFGNDFHPIYTQFTDLRTRDRYERQGIFPVRMQTGPTNRMVVEKRLQAA